ncbi:peptide chain release factor N(5)-glutamine methyltransferase [Ectothiorhodospira mobilis]|uniref:peptide chain release factor N(5)-glutamine methyltransferase n=1 Tax=Ectothiorhodospira mobilis TaxID=195064 RepID=UPI0019031805|nr:peptide chain release factor N(5)-glutamine methyltransferase [Ectothiorhodospira mobilis]MBK1691221.1 protein-(glutamine-N5) methyltransferase, release factor-specific [Ectothiorhodospira mobilis]
MTVDELLAETRHTLADTEAPATEARLLLAAALDRDRAWLYAHGGDPVPDAAAQQARTWARRRAAGEPLAYLLGTREFWSLPLTVGPGVLVPRPDTETLVEAALECIPEGEVRSVADLGTGSGAIALALARERPRATITATDRSPRALERARDNARRLGLAQRIRFLQGDWFGALGKTRFHVLVSNPPYVARGDPHLAALRHEPAEALIAGEDGLTDLRILAAGAPAHLLPGGWLLVEHGADQGAAVRALLEGAGFTAVSSLRDLGGRERVCRGRLPL